MKRTDNNRPDGAPPRLGDRILQWIYIEPDESHLPGDYEELYRDILEDRGKGTALAWYWWQVFHALYSFIFDTLFWSVIMFKNYVKTAYRVMMKSKTVSLINILGLSIGITCCILAFLFVQDELSYDRFHENYDRIVRIKREHISKTGKIRHAVHNHSKWAENLKKDFPVVENAVRIHRAGTRVLSHNGIRFNESPFYVDPSFLEIFTFPLVKGDPATALDGPGKAVITNTVAEKFFGKEEPLGKTLLLDNKHEFIITGVFKKIPRQSHIEIDFVASYTSLKSILGEKRYNNNWTATYLLLNNNVSILPLQNKLAEFNVKMHGEEEAKRFTYSLQPMKYFYLHTKFPSFVSQNKSDLMYSYSYTGISLLVLILACINFINLTTARAVKRAKEIAILKVVGATRSKLVRQHLSETIFIACSALILAIIVAVSVLPWYNGFVNKELQLNLFNNILLLGSLLGIMIITGIAAGLYPSLYISAFQVTDIVKLHQQTGKRGSRTRKLLVVSQFAVSLVFLICTIVVMNQVDYITEKDLGFDSENIIEVPVSNDWSLGQRLNTIKQEMKQNPDIIDMTSYNDSPGRGLELETSFICEGVNDNKPVHLYTHLVGANFLTFFNIEIIQGRDFREDDIRGELTDLVYPMKTAFVLNESAVASLGLKEPIGKKMQMGSMNNGKVEAESEGLIVGVVKDFHTGPLHEPIRPVVFQQFSMFTVTFAFKHAPGKEKTVINYIDEKWKKFSPDWIPLHHYLDDYIARQYNQDKRTQKIFTFAAFLSVFIACIGMFGLAAFSAEQRISEIGIRKVLGASVSSIVGLLSSDFMKLILAANIIAWPVAYYVANRWLQNFAYRIDINPFYFIGSALLLMVISMLTISSYTIKAANTNPVNTLRHE